MFGKGKTRMTGTQKFIMAEGRRVGNLPPLKGDPPTKSGPANMVAGTKGRTNIGALGHAKLSPAKKGQR